MISAILALLLVFAPHQAPTSQVSDTQKKDFIELLKALPHKGEFFTDEAVTKAGPYLPVLFALTEKDIEAYDIYPFAALSRGLCDDKDHRQYATTHFAQIRHPMLKLFWAAMLFDEGKTTPEIVGFLRDALNSDAQAKILAEVIGPKFADFKTRLNVARP